MIEGTGGQGLSPLVDTSDTPYFTTARMGADTPGREMGFVTCTVSADRVDVQIHFSGAFEDHFSIIRPGSGPTPSTLPATFLPALPIGAVEGSFRDPFLELVRARGAHSPGGG